MENIKPHIALLISNTIWALGYPIYSTIMPQYIKPLPMMTLSLCATAVLAWLDLLRKRCSKHYTPSKRVERGDIPKIFIAALLIGLLRKGGLIYGFSLTSTVDGSVIATLVPIVVFIFSLLLGRERYSHQKSIGLALAIAGVASIVATSGSAHRTTSSAMGNIFIIAEVVAMAVYIVAMRPLFTKYDSGTILRWAYTISALISIPIGYNSVINTSYSGVSWQIWAITAYVVILPTYIPNMLLNYALKSLDTTVTSLYGYLQPAIAISIAVATGMDKLHWDSAIFALMMLAGIWLVTHAKGTSRSQ